MEVKDFVSNCVDSGYEWAQGEHEGKAGYFVRSKRLDTKVHIATDAIEKNEWPQLNKGIIQGKDLYHITRIVGYYSKIQNWNKSKVGELKDRHAGNYAAI